MFSKILNSYDRKREDCRQKGRLLVEGPLLLATTNRGKVQEMRAVLADLNLKLLTLQEFPDLPPALEKGSTFSENARIKARHYFHHTGSTAIADDSGLEVNALGGKPGVHSARFALSDAARIQKLLHLLDEQGANRADQRKARFVCALCLYGRIGMIEVEGSVEGVITGRPAGTHGFGFDPVFLYPPLGKTLSELSPEEKNRISHRAQALAKLRRCLICRLGLVEK